MNERYQQEGGERDGTRQFGTDSLDPLCYSVDDDRARRSVPLSACVTASPRPKRRAVAVNQIVKFNRRRKQYTRDCTPLRSVCVC